MVLSVYCALKVAKFQTGALVKNESKNVACMCVIQIDGKRKTEKRVLFKATKNERHLVLLNSTTEYS